MADKHLVNNSETIVNGINQRKLVSKIIATKENVAFVVRVLAFFATLSATLVMALSKEEKSVVLATIGTTPIRANVTAKFQHTPAFVFFVIANAIVSLHNLLVIAVHVMMKTFNFQRVSFLMIAVLDMVNVGLISGGATAAAFMGQLGRKGNSHANWNKICDKVGTFCDHSGAAILASLIALALMTLLTANSIANVRKDKPLRNNVVVAP
ncbi:dehydrogenase [Lithospermum erythrorhizon]|uniref:CASP-like protein n=1 Tax=Lithospermum erythrorhizon TaxID=34254 RepID=A0AAV3R8C1_LITER